MLKKKNLKIISIIIVLGIMIGNQGNAQVKGKRVLFNGTEIQLSKTNNISRKIVDISTYKDFNMDEFVKLNNSQIESWINAFPNIGGYEFYIISLNEEKNYISLFVLARGVADQIHLIHLKHDGSFIAALNILDYHRSGPEEDNKRKVIVHTELKNSIIKNDTIEIIRTQTISKSWESNEFYEKEFKEYFSILPNGKFNHLFFEK